MHDLTAFQRDLLVVIAGMDGAHGLAIKEELDSYYTTDIQYGRIYPNLDSLVENGFVEKGSIDARTNSYSLTDTGAAELAERQQWEDEYVRPSAAMTSSP